MLDLNDQKTNNFKLRSKRYPKNVEYAKYIQNQFSLPLPLEFQERIAMNLKTDNGRIILIDLYTRLSAATIIPNKNIELSRSTYFTMDICIWTTSKDSCKQ